MDTNQRKKSFAAMVEAGQNAETNADLKSARQEYQNALVLFPGSTKALMLLAKLEAHLGFHLTAVDFIQKALGLKPDAPAWWHIRLGQSRAELGELTSAIESYETALRMEPSQLGWNAALKELRRQAASGEIGRLGETSPAFYDDLYADSSTYRQDGEETIYAPMWTRICELLVEKRIKSIFDIGCGPGQFAAFILAHLNAEYIGMDISSVAIDQANNRGLSASFRCGDILSDEMPKGHFDAIVCTEVLEHVEQDLMVLSKFPSGSTAFCSVPSFHAFGHLRTFSNEIALTERYSRFFDDFTVESFALPSSQRLHLFYGTIT